MFAHRMRTITLALAGAAFAATTLMSSVAAAAPQLPGKLPVGDVRVTKTSRSEDTIHNTIFYSFKVKNAGPDQVKVRIEKSCYIIAPNNTGEFVEEAYETTLDKNEEHAVGLDCHWPAGGSVYHGGISAKVVGGIDPYTGNNQEYYNEQ
jgi:hypothetical protein